MTFNNGYQHLNIPDQWNEYFSKYPNGYTILEAVINWAGQVNDMVDTLNSTEDYVNTFQTTFDTDLNSTVGDTLTEWYNDGKLATIINQTVFSDITNRLGELESLQSVNFADYDSYKVAVSGGYDYQPAITKAIADAKAKITDTYAIVLIPPQTYDYYSPVTVSDGVVLVGQFGSLFNAKADAHAFTFGNNTGSYNVGYQNHFSTTRQGGNNNMMLVASATNIWLEKNRIDGSASAGIFITGGVDVKVYKNLVQNTLADGIHSTDGATNVRIEQNICKETGDDAFAVVSYQSQGVQCSDIEIKDNYSYHSKSRGVAVVGGKKVTISGNKIDSPTNAGVYLAYESAYLTYGVDQIDVYDNKIMSANSYNQTTNYGAIHVTTTDINYPVTNVRIFRNHIISPRWRGISLGSTSTTTNLLQYIVVEDNEIIGNTSDGGINYANVQHLTLQNNRLRDIATYGVYDSLYNTGVLIIKGNMITNANKTNTASTYGMNIRSTTYDHIDISLNKISDPNSYLTRTIGVPTQANIIYEKNSFVGGNKVDVVPDLTTNPPVYVGQVAINSAKAVFVATGTTATTDWKLVS